MVSSEEWFEERVLKALSSVDDNEGATCQNMSRKYVDFWPLFPLQRLHQMGQVRAIQGGGVLSSSAVAELDVVRSAEVVVWQLTPAGQARASHLK